MQAVRRSSGMWVVGVAAGVTALLAGLPAGCTHDGTWPARPHDPTLADRTAPGDASALRSAFEPARIRIHPLSRRIDPVAGTPVPAASASAETRAEIEARIEALDRDGIETRTLGELWLELDANGTRWTVGPVNLSNMEMNRETFETVTRTYRLSVTLPEAARPSPGTTISIEAFLRLPGGALLRDRRELVWR